MQRPNSIRFLLYRNENPNIFLKLLDSFPDISVISVNETEREYTGESRMADQLDLGSASDAAIGSESIGGSAPANITPSNSTPATPPAVTQDSQSQAAGSGGQAIQAKQDWTLRAELQQLGVQGEWQDDKAAWGHLSTQLRQRDAEYQQAQQIAQYYRANQQEIQAGLAALAAQRAQGQPKPAEAAADSWWKKPDWNPAHERFLTKDAAGNIIAVPGADPSLPLKYQAHRDWQQEKFSAILNDPIGTLKPGLEQIIEAKAKELIQKHLGGFEERQFATNYVQQSAWMYATGPSGQPVFDSVGSRMLSPAGQKFAGYVNQAQEMGITDVRMQQKFAEGMTQKDALQTFYLQHQSGGAANGQQQAQALTPEQQNAALKEQALRGGARRLPSSGAQNGQGPAAAAGAQRPQDPRLGLGQRLNKRLTEAGITSVN